MKQKFGNYTFTLISDIVPQTENGIIKTFMPQALYQNKRNLSLHHYGAGPFCRFTIPKDVQRAGVYILTFDTIPYYVGECQNLSKRYNVGYGNISPRNCFTGGQSTNCRINNLIYNAIANNNAITLWFYETVDYKAVESELIQTLNVRDKWNRKN